MEMHNKNSDIPWLSLPAIRQISNQRGISLVAVLSASVIAMIIVHSMSLFLGQTFKAQRSIASKDAGRELTAGIHDLLNDQDTCSASFSGNSPIGNGFTANEIIDAGPPPVVKYRSGDSYLNNLVEIIDFQVNSYIADNAAVNPLVGRSELSIRLRKIGSNVGGDGLLQVIYLATDLNGAGNIVNCSALGNVDSLWTRSPADSTDIFYSQGDVGVGTNTPLAKLHVSGGRIWGQFDCRIVTTAGAAPLYYSWAQCGADEFMLNGGGECTYDLSTTERGVLHRSRPTGNGWSVDCYDNTGLMDAPSAAWATCCKTGQ